MAARRSIAEYVGDDGSAVKRQIQVLLVVRVVGEALGDSPKR
jgi:hypothetical protein